MAFCSIAGIAAAGTSVPEKAMQAFAGNCFSPYLTAEKADAMLATTGVRYDFYDLNPFSSADPSPAIGREVSVDTDRRCEVAFDGDHAAQAAKTAVDALQSEGILTDADLPARYSATGGTALLAARRLNPKRVAVVHVGTRQGPNGTETFMTVERLTPAASEY